MTKCKSCEGKGYTEYDTQRGGQFTPVLQQCTTCKDTKAYSREVSRRYAEKPLTASLGNILKFPGVKSGQPD